MGSTYTVTANNQIYTATTTPITVTAAPTTPPAGTGSAGSIPIIGGLLSSLSAK